MNFLLPLLILTAQPDPSTDRRHPDAVLVYHCDFGPKADTNFDQWPDDWRRRTGRGYPQYLPIGIRKEPAAIGEHCLRIQLDGSAAVVYSPPIEVSPRFSYVLEGFLKTDALKHDVAYYAVTFYDARRRPLGRFESQRLRDVSDWRKIHIGPLTPPSDDVSLARISLHLEPTDLADLKGAALFDDVWFARLPRMTLRSNSEHNVYTDPGAVEVICEVSGILESDPMMSFELIDVSSQMVAKTEHRLDTEKVMAKKSSTASALLGRVYADANTEGFAGTSTWKPPIETYGFYRVRVTMRGSTGLMHERNMTLAVVRPYERPSGGEFGWSLPGGDDPVPLEALAGLLDLAHINWVKFPLWFSDKELERANRLVWFVEQLNSQGIEIVGMLHRPPKELRQLFGTTWRHVAARLFAEPELWYPALDPVMTRLSMKVRWWQLGDDHDTSFMGSADFESKIRQVKQRMGRFGQEIHLGVGWSWLNEPPATADPSWEFLSLTADPPLTPEELATHLTHPATNLSGTVQRWVILRPLPRTEYDVEIRAKDLVERMLTAKIQDANLVFITQPFSTEYGLMNDDGTPGDLLLPWRTTARLISGTQYIGSINLPNGSHNYIFGRGSEAVMVVWNEKPTTETIFLGDEIQQIDLWGRSQVPKKVEHRQVVEVTSMPTFITGVSQPITRWRRAFSFEKKQLSSIFGRPQPAAYHIKNTFDRGVGGQVTLVTPPVWEASPTSIRFNVAAGEGITQDFQVTLRPDASSGSQAVRVDFEIIADCNYKFSAYRKIDVGLGDVVIDVDTYLNEHGDLVIEQHLTNKTDRFVGFNCMLFSPGRRRIRQQVLNLSRGRDTKVYVLPNGEQLLGKRLWIRAQEVGGERILNLRFVAER